MTNLAISLLALSAVLSAVSMLTWRSGGKSLLAAGMLNAGLGGAMLAPAGWPRYILVAVFVGVAAWILARTTTTVFSRYRWGLLLIGVALAGIALVEFSPALARENENVALSVIGLVMIVGLAILAFLAIQDIRTATKQTR